VTSNNLFPLEVLSDTVVPVELTLFPRVAAAFVARVATTLTLFVFHFKLFLDRIEKRCLVCCIEK
jgi:hypothetical protein